MSSGPNDRDYATLYQQEIEQHEYTKAERDRLESQLAAARDRESRWAVAANWIWAQRDQIEEEPSLDDAIVDALAEADLDALEYALSAIQDDHG